MDYCGPAGIPHSRFLGWSQGDRDKALWWSIHRRQRCPHCGTRPEDWEDDPNAFVAEPVHCRGCEVKGRQEAHLEAHRGEYRRGTFIQLTRRT